MIKFDNGGILVETADELPSLPDSISDLYLDFETSSQDPKLKSLNPWDVPHCRVIGAAVTWDDHPYAYFVPRHLLLSGWLLDVMNRSGRWVNHNVKYDVHVASNDLCLEWYGPPLDTISLAKIYDADRTYKGGYGLDVLSLQLLDRDISRYERAMQPYLPTKGKHANKDYGRVPIDILAEYGCEDALAVRRLHKWLLKKLPEESSWVQANESRLTQTLVDIERRGLFIDPIKVKTQLLVDKYQMITISEQLKDKLGYEINPTSPDDCYDLLINRYCFPVIYNDNQLKKAAKGEIPNASFDQDILSQYVKMGHQWAPYSDVVQMILDYREASQRCSLFWTPWLDLVDQNGVLHSDYNANVRSGRMSCKQPNSQQLSYIAKTLILARPGRRLLCWDYSQLEYRWMVHYLQNPHGIKAYNEDPRTDYHQWVASTLCAGLVKRRPAKTLNFTIGFGGGKNRVIRMLSIEPDIVEACHGDPMEIKRFATSVFYTYHRNLPELKSHSRMAENAARLKGYVQTLYGRRLHLPPEFARKGFNRVVQSTAADNAKEALNDASPTHNERLRQLDVHLIAQVHDEFLYDVPDDPEVMQLASDEITQQLEAPSKRCRVPIRATRGILGAETWAQAKPD